jgi:hypothetical protein
MTSFFGGGYASPQHDTVSSPFWAPNALKNPNVPYPASPFSNNGTVRRGNGMGNWMANENAVRAQQAAAQGTNPNAVFGVKTGDFGGAGVFGVKTGDFGGAMANNTTFNGAAGGGMAAGGGGAAGGGMGAGGGLFGQFQNAYNQARQANEARYQDILSGYSQRYQRGMGMLAGLGQQQGRDINELYDQQRSQQDQNLIGRGLGNSTVLDTMRMGSDRERNADLNRLNDSVRQQAIGTDAGLTGDTLQFMERKNDSYPDFGLLAQLSQGMGAAGYGGGGGGIGSPGGGMGMVYGPPMMGMGGDYMGPSSSYGGLSPQAAAMYAAKNAGKKGDADYNALMASMTNMPAGAAPVTPWSDSGGFGDAYANWAAANGGEDPLRMYGTRFNAPVTSDTSMNAPYGY